MMQPLNDIQIMPIRKEDRNWVADLCSQRWGSTRVAVHGVLYIVLELQGFIAWQADARLGLLTYSISDNQMEIVTLDSLHPGIGIGTRLLFEAMQLARQLNCRRIWLVTTNDNTPALRFYQKKGFSIVRIFANALQESRKLKPEIPLTGLDGIPIQDEIELDIKLN
jgi:ribosomal protein S18 acetylase RimI-like enzyme